MKKSILTLLISCSAIITFAQKVKPADVPQAVKDAQAKMYPNAEHTKWEKEGANYEAEFENNEVETSVVYSADGIMLETEIEIAATSLPQAAQDYVKNTLGGKKIKEASKITTAAGIVTFEAEVGGKDYLFDSNGNYTGVEAESNSDKK